MLRYTRISLTCLVLLLLCASVGLCAGTVRKSGSSAIAKAKNAVAGKSKVTQLPGVRKEKTIKRILIMGNSLTHSGPSTDALGWPGDWGMAATALENDYSHQLYRLICENQPGTKPELRVQSLYELVVKNFKPDPTYKPDLVVVEVGDNWPQEQINMTDVGEPYGRLLALLNINSNPLIVCVSDWGGRGDLNAIMKQEAQKHGAMFVEIFQLHTHENTAASEGHFTHPGVNWHPGDKGMKAIAETLWKAIKPKL